MSTDIKLIVRMLIIIILSAVWMSVIMWAYIKLILSVIMLIVFVLSIVGQSSTVVSGIRLGVISRA